MNEYLFFTKSNGKIKNILKILGEVLGGELNDTNVIIEKSDFGWYHVIPNTNNKYIDSFILCKPDDEINLIHAYLICNINKYITEGSELLTKVEEYARDNRYMFLQIESLGSNVSYYINKGYYIVSENTIYTNMFFDKIYDMRKLLH